MERPASSILPDPNKTTFTPKERARVHAALSSYQRAHKLDNISKFARQMGSVCPHRVYDRQALSRYLRQVHQPYDTTIRNYIEFLNETDFLRSPSRDDLAAILPSFFLPEPHSGEKPFYFFAENHSEHRTGLNPAGAAKFLEGRYYVRLASPDKKTPLSKLTLSRLPNAPFLQVEEDVFNLYAHSYYSMDKKFPRYHFTGIAVPIDLSGIFLLRDTLTRRPRVYLIGLFWAFVVPTVPPWARQLQFEGHLYEFRFPHNLNSRHYRVICEHETKAEAIPRTIPVPTSSEISLDPDAYRLLNRLEGPDAMLLTGTYRGQDAVVHKALEAGASINVCDPFTGLTAFHLAVGTNNLDLARFLLLEAGAEIFTDRFQRWPSDIALETASDDDVIDFVLEAENQRESR